MWFIVNFACPVIDIRIACPMAVAWTEKSSRASHGRLVHIKRFLQKNRAMHDVHPFPSKRTSELIQNAVEELNGKAKPFTASDVTHNAHLMREKQTTITENGEQSMKPYINLSLSLFRSIWSAGVVFNQSRSQALYWSSSGGRCFRCKKGCESVMGRHVGPRCYDVGAQVSP